MCLQELTISSSTASAAQLLRLSAALTAPRGALTAVELGYDKLAAAAAAAPAWHSLPMTSLRLCTDDESYLPAQSSSQSAASHVPAVLSGLSQLTGLTELIIGGGYLDATAQQLADTLAVLTSLEVSTCGLQATFVPRMYWQYGTEFDSR